MWRGSEGGEAKKVKNNRYPDTQTLVAVNRPRRRKHDYNNAIMRYNYYIMIEHLLPSARPWTGNSDADLSR